MGGLPDSGAAQVPAVFGNLELPDFPGSGGSAEVQASPAQFRGGNGGGLARILAGTIALEGSIDASGAGVEHPDLFDTTHAGAGAGGTVRILAGVLRGAGSILAAGRASLFFRMLPMRLFAAASDALSGNTAKARTAARRFGRSAQRGGRRLTTASTSCAL